MHFLQRIEKVLIHTLLYFSLLYFSLLYFSLLYFSGITAAFTLVSVTKTPVSAAKTKSEGALLKAA